MKVTKEVYEFITWDTPTNSIVNNIEAILLNGELSKIKFRLGTSSSRGQNVELSLKNSGNNVQAIRKLYEVFGDLLDFIDGKPLAENTKNDRKRMIQIRDIKTTTFEDEDEEK